MGGLKRIAILGSTGSIGQQTLEVARVFSNKFKVIALGAGSNTRLLASQVNEFQPRMVSFQGPKTGLEQSLPVGRTSSPRLVSLEEMASHPDVDLVVVATAGKAGLAPTLAAIRTRKEVALANKEVLVMAGEMVMAEARKYYDKALEAAHQSRDIQLMADVENNLGILSNVMGQTDDAVKHYKQSIKGYVAI